MPPSNPFKSKPYKGVLLEPMPARLAAPGAYFEGMAAFAERIGALYQHYLGPPDTARPDPMNDPFKIMMGLAYDHVPGFSFETTKKTGPDPKVGHDIMILTGVFQRIEDGHTVNNAARLLSKRHPKLGKPDTIRRRWYRLQKDKDVQGRVVHLIRLMKTYGDH